MSVGPLPEPPADLGLNPRTLSGPCWRIHRTDRDALFFGNKKQENRFDDSNGSFGVLYAGISREAAVVETVLRVPHGGVVTTAQLEGRSMARIEFSSPLRVVALHGAEIGALHLDTRICSTEDYGICQRWSRAIHNHAVQPDGIIYQSRHNSDLLCLALFDRVATKLAAHPQFATLLDNGFRAELVAILDRYNIALIDSST